MSDTVFEINVSQYTAKALTEATHTDELVKSGYTNIRIDYKSTGMGSASCGPQDFIPHYCLKDRHISFAFYVAIASHGRQLGVSEDTPRYGYDR